MLNLTVIFVDYVLAKVCVSILKTEPDSFGAVCPKAVNELVFPLVASLSDWLVLFVNENCLNTGRAKLDTENGFTCFYRLFCGHKTLYLCTEGAEETEVTEED